MMMKIFSEGVFFSNVFDFCMIMLNKVYKINDYLQRLLMLK